MPRDRLHGLIVSLPPSVIDIETYSSAHHWARLLQASGQSVRVIAPQFVPLYRITGKRGDNGAADATIYEDIQRPHMRFVPVKTPDQQSR